MVVPLRSRGAVPSPGLPAEQAEMTAAAARHAPKTEADDFQPNMVARFLRTGGRSILGPAPGFRFTFGEDYGFRGGV
jgi:hypothetical protein